MAAVIGGVVIGGWELAGLAAAGLAALFLASPQGQEATKEAAKATAEALEKLRPVPDPENNNKPEPTIDPIPPIQPCPKEKDKDKKEKCPVCGVYPNPTPGVTPAYVTENRVPMDSETTPPLNTYKRTGIVVKGARVYEKPDGSLIHRDTLHKGKAAELEVYDRRGKHTGTACPHCGAPRGGAEPGRTLDRYK